MTDIVTYDLIDDDDTEATAEDAALAASLRESAEVLIARLTDAPRNTTRDAAHDALVAALALLAGVEADLGSL